MHEVGRQDDEELTEGMHERARQELTPGERILWAGRPHTHAMGPGCRLKAMLLLVVAPACVGIGLLLWALQSEGGGDAVGFGAGLIVSAACLWALMAWANRIARRARETTFYLLTDRRAITWTVELGSQITVRSYYPQDLRGMHRKENPDGSGSIILSEITAPGHKGAITVQARGFLGISRVREVEQKVRDALLSSDRGE